MHNVWTTTGRIINLFSGVSVFTPPASETDVSAGYPLNPGDGYLAANGMAPVYTVIRLSASVATSISNLRVLAFERGSWATLAVPGAGTVVFPSLELDGIVPSKFVVENIGQPTRIGFLGTIGAGTISGSIQEMSLL